MLVLSRKSGEGVQVGEAVVWVRLARKGRVELAIEAPREVRITRVAPDELTPPLPVQYDASVHLGPPAATEG